MQQNEQSIRKPVSKKWIGLFLIAAGLLLIADRLNAGIPQWLVSWPMAVISIGLLVGIYHRFRTAFWIIPVFWGAFLMLEVQMPQLNLGAYAGAVSIIVLGLVFLLIQRVPGFRIKNGVDKKNSGDSITTILSHNKRNITSDNFTNSNVVCVMGNTEIQFNTAFVQETAEINITLLMGTAMLIVPANWVIKNEITPLLCTVADRRPIGLANQPGINKMVVLKGTVLLGSIDITDKP